MLRFGSRDGNEEKSKEIALEIIDGMCYTSNPFFFIISFVSALKEVGLNAYWSGDVNEIMRIARFKAFSDDFGIVDSTSDDETTSNDK